MPASRPETVHRHGLTRRTFLKGSLAAGAAVAGGGLWTTAIQPRRVRAAETPIKQVVFSMM
jgi:secreted PhoX family phosphatase